MIKLEELKKVLEDAQLPKKEVGYTDFDKIVSLVEKEDLKALTFALKASFSSGITDVRLIFYSFYVHFLENGIYSFQETLPFIHSLVEEYYLSLRPQDKLESHFESSLGWFFSRVMHKFKTIEKVLKSGKTHPVWEKSKKQVSDLQFQALLDVATQFSAFFYQKWPSSPLKEKVSHLVKKIEETKEMVLKKEIKEEEEIPIQEDVIVIEEKLEIETSLPKQEQPLESGPLNFLIKKMKVFDSLVEKQEFFKASIVAKDISNIVENFDPALYFPKLFASYFATLAQSIGILSDEWSQQDSLKWIHFNKLYKTDVDKFMQTDVK